MNVDVPLADSRRIEVLANGLPLWQGAQAAVDTTCASPVSRDGTARAGADHVPGKAAADAARRKRQATYPELLAARRWCWRLRWADDSVPKWRIFPAAWRRATAGQTCWLLPRSDHAPCHSLSCRWTGQTSVMGRSRCWQPYHIPLRE